MSFMGYRRPDGVVGIRNHMLIISTVVCANAVVQRIATRVAGAITVTHQHGCSMVRVDTDRFRRTLLGFASHPNVGGVLIVGLGCEQVEAVEVANAVSNRGRPASAILIHECGGESNTVGRGVDIAKRIFTEAQMLHREPVPLTELVLATECGASDYSSGISANPVIGRVSDRLVEEGGTVIMSETTEMIGAEHILARRCANEDVARRLLEIVACTEEVALQTGVDIRGSQPTPGNIRGGLTTIAEKSLGCLQKTGVSRVQGLVEYAESPQGKGLWIMDTPGQDVESITGMVAGGAHMVVFSTGLGTPVGCPIAPVVKITGNQETAGRMAEHIDFNAGLILENQEDIRGVGDRLYQLVVEVASGRLTKAERLGHSEFAISKTEPTL